MITGLLATALVGIAGAFVSELIKIAGAFRAGKPPARNEYIASALFTVLGVGALAFGWENNPALDVAVLGSAFPMAFTALTRAYTARHDVAPVTPAAPATPVTPRTGDLSDAVIVPDDVSSLTHGALPGARIEARHRTIADYVGARY